MIKPVFDNTCSVIPKLVEYLEEYGDSFEASSGNSTGTKKSCKELRGVSFEITRWDDRAEMMDQNGLSVAFAETDLLDRISNKPVNPGRAINLDKVGVLSKYLRSNGKLDYTYSERMYYQLAPIINLLRVHPETRQAFLSVWNPDLDLGNLESLRVPCSIGFHFLRRGDKLNLVYYMRSLEVTKCLGNDIYTSSRLLEYFCLQLGIYPGTITFVVGSLHMFPTTR